MGAVRGEAVAVEGERVLLQSKAMRLGNEVLTLLDRLVKELLHMPTVQADEMVVVAARIELKDRLAGFKVRTPKNACLGELGEHPIDGGQADIEPLGEHQLVDILCAQVAQLGLLKQSQDFEPGNSDLEPGALDVRGQRVVNLHGAMIAVPGLTTSPFFMKQTRSRLTACVLLSLGLALLGGCAGRELPNWLSPYRPEVSQGNVVTSEQASRLVVGMTREQVRTLLGTPMLVDPFRDQRWDYVFDLRRVDGSRERRRFFVEFEAGRLARWSGDQLPQTPVELLTSRAGRR